MYKVYWIKDTNHTDPYYDGYVGSTFCGVEKYSKENRAKYCSIKCAAANRNKNDEYRKGLSDRARKRWADDDYKKRVSISIRKSLRAD